MESVKQVMLSSSSVFNHSVALKSTDFGHSSSNGKMKEVVNGNPEGYIGVLEVVIHQARDIHNICIYHKQDVYAKICLTSDPERSVLTQTINGGGQNPVFNENLRINVSNIDCSLRCEIWMLSRVRNYLEDQLLGFALVPLSDILVANGNLAQEFELSSSDLFHSPSGFVKLTIAYTGSAPEVLELPAPPPSLAINASSQASEVCDPISCELEKIEFPDPKVANENEMMVTEYYSIPCPDGDSPSLVSCETTEKEDHPVLQKETLDTNVASKVEIPTKEPLSVIVPASPESVCDTPGTSKSTSEEVFPSLKGKKENGTERVHSTLPQPIISINMEPEQNVVQQDIVDMYMKSMQQFTEALAKMKLPMDIENKPADSGNAESDVKIHSSKGEGPSPKVFYGSRAFF